MATSSERSHKHFQLDSIKIKRAQKVLRAVRKLAEFRSFRWQVNSPQSTPRNKTHDAVVWWTTPVEIASALARIMRMKQLDARDWAKTGCGAESPV